MLQLVCNAITLKEMEFSFCHSFPSFIVQLVLGLFGDIQSVLNSCALLLLWKILVLQHLA